MYENDINSIKRAQNGDRFEMDRLLRDNNGLIWSIVKRFMNRGYEAEDLYQIGCIGFIKSIKRFTFCARFAYADIELCLQFK